jgi:ion channel POLLUX/CASTOR
MKMFTWQERLRYAFDNTLARGTIALIAWLATAVVIAIAALLIVVTGLAPEGGESLSFGEAAWASLMRTLDAGTMGGDTGWGYRAIMFLVTLTGIFILSTLIGVLSSGLEGRIEQLRKGRSRVVETGHTVILGWSEQIFAIVTELIEANQSRPDAAIVVLAPNDKVEMEDALRSRIAHRGTTRLVCRTGDPTDPVDLKIASLEQARSIVLLASERTDDDHNADVDTVKSLLAIVNDPQRSSTKYNIVAEIRDPRHAELAKLVGKDEVEVVLVGDLIARIIAQTCRQSGLSVVYNDLLDFAGDEIYCRDASDLVGQPFSTALQAYENASVLGLLPRGGRAALNPSRDTLIQAGDQLVCVAADDAGWSRAVPLVPPTLMAKPVGVIRHPEHVLVLGWNWRGARLVSELDQYVAAGSSITIFATQAEPHDVEEQVGGLVHAQLRVEQRDITERASLELAFRRSYAHVIVLCESDHTSARQADNRTLMTLLLLRAIMAGQGTRASVVTEMLDVKNRQLAEAAQVDDFIVSDRMISLMLAQITENPRLGDIFAQLFQAEGSEVYLKPVERYVATGTEVSMAALIEIASHQGEVAFGFRIAANANDASKNHGVTINPNKSTQVRFAPGDQLVVLALDEG